MIFHLACAAIGQVYAPGVVKVVHPAHNYFNISGSYAQSPQHDRVWMIFMHQIPTTMVNALSVNGYKTTTANLMSGVLNKLTRTSTIDDH